MTAALLYLLLAAFVVGIPAMWSDFTRQIERMEREDGDG